MTEGAASLSEGFYQAIRSRGISHLVTVANGETGGLVSRFESDPECKVIPACREGEGVAIAAGLILGGKDTVVCMECIGLFESGESLRGLAVVMEIPMLLVLGYFGERTPGWEQKFAGLGGMLRNVEVGSAWTKPILEAMELPYYTVNGVDELPNLEKALNEARDRSGPVAVLVEMLGD
jgi:sulfopyruvate decarboxylase TPP-binding subunit